MKKELFTIYQVDNGFMGETVAGGIVIGATMSETCASAQAHVAEQMLLGDDGPTAEDPLNQRNKQATAWQKLP